MTIEQAIEQYEQYINFCEYQGLVARREELEQITAWLRELQERRKEPEIIFCKDCAKHNKDTCPLVLYRGKAQGHEFDYQYCAFAERRTK